MKFICWKFRKSDDMWAHISTDLPNCGPLFFSGICGSILFVVPKSGTAGNGQRSAYRLTLKGHNSAVSTNFASSQYILETSRRDLLVGELVFSLPFLARSYEPREASRPDDARAAEARLPGGLVHPESLSPFTSQFMSPESPKEFSLDARAAIAWANWLHIFK